ncbi:DMT family transporter [Cyclobacteriaceae bacterium]|jgi:drug/metabolite transporter (DMT)-like permease|nr:DMT family transporter [Cyclobacteriaceae bacterium]|tara:strand:- start:51 stop:935 length:885 start_codon:yes stop_codon:yes gene_type:complete
MKATSTLNIVELGIAILVMSTSGVLGKQIDLPVVLIIWSRCLLGAIALFLIRLIFNNSCHISRSDRTKMILPTLLMGVHWLAYFYALKLSNVAIGMLTLFTYPLMTSILEPVLLKDSMVKRHLPLTLITLVGIYFLMPNFDMNDDLTVGVLFGLLAALSYAIRNILIRKHIEVISGSLSMAYQLLGLSIVLGPLLFFYPLEQNQYFLENTGELFILGFVTTAVGHTLFVRSFKYFSVTTVSIMSNLTPVLGIGWGMIFLSEMPNKDIYIGGSVILLVTLVEIFFNTKLDKKNQS